MTGRLGDLLERGVEAAGRVIHGEDGSGAVDLLAVVADAAVHPEVMINALLLEVAALRNPPMPDLSPDELLAQNAARLNQGLGLARAVVATLSRAGASTRSRAAMEQLVKFVHGLDAHDRNQLTVNALLAAGQLERSLRDYQAMNNRLNRRGGK